MALFPVLGHWNLCWNCYSCRLCLVVFVLRKWTTDLLLPASMCSSSLVHLPLTVVVILPLILDAFPPMCRSLPGNWVRYVHEQPGTTCLYDELIDTGHG